MKTFDINEDTILTLEISKDSTDLEKEQYYLAQLRNNEWGYNKDLTKFVFKIDDAIYYMQVKLKQFRCCGQLPAELVGYILEKTTLPTGEVATRILRKDMNTMPFKIKDEEAFLKYYFKNL